MKLSRVVMQGFRSFQAEQAFDFTQFTPGLYYVHGRNEAEPWLEANGAGKSNLFEAVHWGLFGTTSRRQRGNGLKNWHSNHRCHVILELETAAGQLAIFRQQGPNVLEVSVNGAQPHPVDQAELEALVGMNSEGFLFGIFQSQFEDRFLDLQPAKQMGIYSAVLSLDLWERLSSLASARARDAEQAVNKLRQDLARLEGQAQSLVELSYDKDEAAWDVEHAHSVSEFEKQIKGAEALTKDLAKTVEKYRDGSAQFRAKREKVEEAARKVSNASSEHRRLEKQLDELKRKDLKNCPTCGAPLRKDNAHLKNEIKKLTDEIAAANKAIEACMAEHDARMREMVKFRDAEVKLLDAEKAFVREEENLRNLVRQHKRMTENVVNPFTVKKQEQAALAKKLEKDLTDCEAALEIKERAQKATAHWTGGFKQVRLMLIKESLTQLQVESNESLYQLGLKDWALEFDVERETKSGTIDRNFTVSVRAPGLKDPQAWEAWCGGESQRLRLAGTLGFSNLICSRLGVAPNVEFWDEPTAWLSGRGISDLLDVLAARAEAQQKVILLADHKVLDRGAFAGTVTVVKDKSGSHFEL